MQKKEIGIGILGLGNIGGGAYKILEENYEFIEKEITPIKLKVVGLADLDITRKPESKIYQPFFTSSAQEVIEHPEIDIIIETIGGEYPAYNFIKKALQSGKHVVTPNKELIAKHGYELLEIASENKVLFLFETSVASAIPILGTLSNMLTSCPLESITGILNGTTNYILDLMFEENISQEDALKKAQEMGYAEADPFKDVMGFDSLYKIFILSSLGFRTRLDLSLINPLGIDKVKHADMQLARDFGYKIKLLATSQKSKNEVEISVRPQLIDQHHIFSKIYGADNGILLYGKSYGNLFFSGAGAGSIAGGSMVVSDIIRITRNPDYFEYSYLLQKYQKLQINKFKQVKYKYFIRLQLEGINQKDYKEFLIENGLPVNEFTQKVSENNTSNLGFLINYSEEENLKKILEKLSKQDNNVKEISYMPVFEDDVLSVNSK